MNANFYAMVGLVLIVTMPVFIYFVRLESRLTKIETLLSLIKSGITACPLTSDKNIP